MTTTDVILVLARPVPWPIRAWSKTSKSHWAASRGFLVTPWLSLKFKSEQNFSFSHISSYGIVNGHEADNFVQNFVVMMFFNLYNLFCVQNNSKILRRFSYILDYW